MGMVVRSNIMALNANRQLGMNNSQVSKSLEKLSSGFKINRAGDDASGLAISEKMKAQIKGLEQASANSQDGISLVQTAEGALTEVHDMLNRMTELATKSANGTIQDEVDRDAIQSEVDALNDEIDRIARSTNFNGINLLDGSLAGAGGGTGSSMTTGKVYNFTAASMTGTASGAIADADIVNEKMVIDGVVVDVNWADMTSEEKSALTKDWDTTNAKDAKKAAEVVTNFLNAAIDKHNAANGTSVEHVTMKSSGINGFTLTGGTKNKDSSISFVDATAGTLDTAQNAAGVVGKLINGEAKTAATTASLAGSGVAVGDTFTMSIDGKDVVVKLTGGIDAADPTADAGQLQTDLQTALTSYINTTYGDADHSPFAASDVTVKATNDGRFEITNNTGVKISFSEFDGGETASKLGLTGSAGGSTGGLVLQVGDTNDDYNKVTVSVEDMSAKGLGVSGLRVDTIASAGGAIDKIKAAINTVSTNRANMGAVQNRLEHTINNLDVAAENMTAANSRIRDTDMAKQMMDYTKMNVLTQSAQAMLAQANQQPQSILQLLQ